MPIFVLSVSAGVLFGRVFFPVSILNSLYHTKSTLTMHVTEVYLKNRNLTVTVTVTVTVSWSPHHDWSGKENFGFDTT